MREEPADEAEIHAFRGVSESISWLAGQTRPDVSCQVSQLQQTLPQPTVAQVSASGMVVRRVHKHADVGLKIRRMPVESIMLWLHVDASLNTGGLVGLQGGYVCGVTDKSLLEGMDAPWSPLAWRTFKMSRTVPSSLGAETQAMSVACLKLQREAKKTRCGRSMAPPPSHAKTCKNMYLCTRNTTYTTRTTNRLFYLLLSLVFLLSPFLCSRSLSCDVVLCVGVHVVSVVLLVVWCGLWHWMSPI